MEKVTWPGTKWDRTPTGKYQLFLHNLNTVASVWMVFIKKNIIPTCHDNTISMDRIMPVYCIMMEIPVNVGEIISKNLTTRIKHPRGVNAFLHFTKQFCIKSYLG